MMTRSCLVCLLSLAAVVPPLRAARGEVAESRATPLQIPPGAVSIQQKLLTRAEFEYQAVPLLEFVKRVSEKHNLPLRVDERAVRNAGISLDVHVSALYPTVTVRAALFATLRKYGLRYRIDEDRLVIEPTPRVSDAPLLQQMRENAEELQLIPPRKKPAAWVEPLRIQLVPVGPGNPAPRLRLGSNALNEWLSGEPGFVVDEAGTHLDERLRARIATMDRVCGLTDPQKRKLELAGGEDNRRLLERIDELRQRFEPLKEGFGKAVLELHDGALMLREPLAYGPYDEGSLFAKVLSATLTAEQAAAWKESRKKR